MTEKELSRFGALSRTARVYLFLFMGGKTKAGRPKAAKPKAAPPAKAPVAPTAPPLLEPPRTDPTPPPSRPQAELQLQAWPPTRATSEEPAVGAVQPSADLQEQREVLAALLSYSGSALDAARTAPAEGLPVDSPEAKDFLLQLRVAAVAVEREPRLGLYRLYQGPALGLATASRCA